MKLKRKTPRTLFQRKQDLARVTGARYYGDGGTIHGNTKLDVVLNSRGQVTRVWYRCQMLPFEVSINPGHGDEAPRGSSELPLITGVEVIDP